MHSIVKNGLAIGLVALLVACQPQAESSQGEAFLRQVDQLSSTVQNDSALLTFFGKERTPLVPAFTPLPQGSTRPSGWLLDIMQTDLRSGVVGALDELYPGIQKDDLYRTARRAGLEDVPEMGDLVLTGAPWEQSIMWWNAETAGNWWDGFVRYAYLVNDATAIDQAEAIVANLLESQDADGYLGIYQPSLRYQHEGSNGELWAQTTAFRTLLGYYEITQDQAALEAVERAMALTMSAYGPQGQNPFELKNAFGGVTHGLMLTDVCETLHRITGKRTYRDYATYLYEAFSTYNINRAFNDLRYPSLLAKDSLFTGHGVHTYEHFRTLVAAYYHTGYPELKTAYDNALHKLNKAILPSGAGHGNEWLLGVEADPTYTSTEYCSMLELRNSLSALFQKTGATKFADQAEKLTYNGMMGFRNAEGTAITYGKGDNCYILDGHHHGPEETHVDVRYKYSPTHSDPAVCCVPNYARNYPYFLDQLWLRAPDGLVAAMYAPSTLQTTVAGTEVTIHQITNYPFSDQIQLVLELVRPQRFALYFRQPEWTESMVVRSKESTESSKSGFLRIEKEWQTGDTVHVEFEQAVRAQQLTDSTHYFQRGALVYAYSIPHREETIKEYPNSDFRDYYCFPQTDVYRTIKLPASAPIRFSYQEITPGKNPWYVDLPMLQIGETELVPMGSTVLRRVTFPKE